MATVASFPVGGVDRCSGENWNAHIATLWLLNPCAHVVGRAVVTSRARAGERPPAAGRGMLCGVQTRARPESRNGRGGATKPESFCGH